MRNNVCTFLLAGALALTLAGCGGKGNKQKTENEGAVKVEKASWTTLTHNEFVETRVMSDSVKVTWIQDNREPRLMPVSLFADADPALVDSLGVKEGVPATVSVFLVESQGKLILFDAGLGAPDSRLPEALKTLNLSPEKIDYVCLTHFHGDHIGGLLKDGKAAFPQAQLYFSGAEYRHWTEQKSGNEQLQQVLDAYKGRLHPFLPAATLPGGVKPMTASGHTPGHTVYAIGKLLVVGDILHGAALQLADSKLCARFDMDREKATLSRVSVLRHARRNGLLIAGMHLPAPAFLTEWK